MFQIITIIYFVTMAIYSILVFTPFTEVNEPKQVQLGTYKTYHKTKVLKHNFMLKMVPFAGRRRRRTPVVIPLTLQPKWSRRATAADRQGLIITRRRQFSHVQCTDLAPEACDRQTDGRTNIA